MIIFNGIIYTYLEGAKVGLAMFCSFILMKTT